MKDELLHELKRCIVTLKTRADLQSQQKELASNVASLAESHAPPPSTENGNILVDFGENPSIGAQSDAAIEVVTAVNFCAPKKPSVVHIVRDSDPELKRLCVMVEKVFRRGLRQQSSVFGIVKKDYWSWLEYLAESKANINPHFSIIVQKIKSSAKFLTAQGRGRCFIRAALNKKILHVPIELMYKNTELLHSLYDPLASLFTNEDSREFILGLFSGLLTAIHFDLKIRNASFLDETWELPEFRQLELVPSEDLGLTIRYVHSRAVVVDADPYGVAGEDGKVEIGDVIDEVHQISVYDSKPIVIQQILQDHAGWPITIGVIKPRLPPTNQNTVFFQPIEKRLYEISVTYPKVKRLLDSVHSAPPEDCSDPVTACVEGKQYWLCTYIGEMPVGSVGGSTLIEPTIQKLLKNRCKTSDREVLVAAYEADVTVLDRQTKQHQWTHSFPEISSCGRRVDSNRCFAYIVGNNICNIADSFVCHLFEAPNAEVSREILQNVAQGFKRTTWLT
jgi:hypothetical protein